MFFKTRFGSRRMQVVVVRLRERNCAGHVRNSHPQTTEVEARYVLIGSFCQRLPSRRILFIPFKLSTQWSSGWSVWTAEIVVFLQFDISTPGSLGRLLFDPMIPQFLDYYPFILSIFIFSTSRSGPSTSLAHIFTFFLTLSSRHSFHKHNSFF